jgi:hypothetical protein
LVPVEIRRDWSFVRVLAGELDVRYLVGRRTPRGWGLRVAPRRLATTSGSTRASDHHAITRVMGSWRGAELGALAPLTPDPGLGYGTAFERPSVTTLVTTHAASLGR